MKNNCTLLCLVLLLFFSFENTKAQKLPAWVKDINALPDTGKWFSPVKVINYDLGNVVYSLSYFNSNNSGKYITYLDKFSDKGTHIWRVAIDSTIKNNPIGADMAVDELGNCYIAGSFLRQAQNGGMLLKVDSAGNIKWLRDSTTTFNNEFRQVILKNNLLYIAGSSGIAQFDLNGNEIWSHSYSIAYYVAFMAVDNKGQLIITTGRPNTPSVLRYSSNGVLNFSDTSHYGSRIVTDADNSFYLLEETNADILTKYDSTGNLQWVKHDFPMIAFPIQNFDLLVDYYNDVVVVLGSDDSIYKFSPSGNRIWAKPLPFNFYSKYCSALATSNFIAITGSIDTISGFNMGLDLLDQKGNIAWQGIYGNSHAPGGLPVNINAGPQEIYIIQSFTDSASLVKFSSPAFDPIDFSKICVDSIWYDPSNPHFINLRVFNGSTGFLNYPSVQGVSPLGDTIINPENMVEFFGQIGNTYTTYRDSVTTAGITDFSRFRFLMSQGFGNTMAIIGLCNALMGVPEVVENEIIIYPNPAGGRLTINGNKIAAEETEIMDLLGRVLLTQKVLPEANTQSIDISKLPRGIYLVRLHSNNTDVIKKFVKE